MNRDQFIEALQRGLEDVPAEERVAALQYYTEYLDDAGAENEADALAELGDPDRITAEIRADSEREGWTPPERTHEARIVREQAKKQEEAGAGDAPAPPAAEVSTATQGNQAPPPPDGMWGGSYPVIQPGEDGQSSGRPPLPPDYQQTPPQGGQMPPQEAPFAGSDLPPQSGEAPPQGGQQPPPQPGAPGYGYPPQAQAQPERKPRSTGQIIALVLAIIFLWPFIIVFIAVLFVLIVALAIILAVPLIVGVCLVIAAPAAMFFSGLIMVASVPSGILMMGLSILVLGLGLLCAWGGIVLLKKAVPPIFKGLFNLVKKIFQRV